MELSHPTLANYSFQRQLGKGSYGSVWRATHEPSGTKCAVKIIKLKDKSEYVMRRHALMVAREVYILNKLSRDKNNNFTIRLLDVETNPEAHEDFSKLHTVYLVSNFEQTDLNELMAD